MSPAPSNVVRQAVRFWPTSNTEINVARLPDPTSLKTMALRYREEPVSYPGAEARFVKLLIAGIVLGSLWASFSLALPAILVRAWRQMQAIEGLPVVVAMLVTMALLIGLLSLVFVSGTIRKGLAALLLPIVTTSIASNTGYQILSCVPLLAGSLLAATVWRNVFSNFHESWLSADPRIKGGETPHGQGRWIFPSAKDLGLLLSRVLSYDAPHSGAAGVWIAPSSLRTRVMLAGALAGGLFALNATVASLLAHRELTQVVLSLIGSSLSLTFFAYWIVGDAIGATCELENIVGHDTRSVWEQYVERISNSEHASPDVINGSSIREAEHLFLGVEPWQNFPILLHRQLLHEHAYIVGRTGSGKTSMGLMQILIQTIRGYRLSEEQWSEKSPVVILDLKGDEVLFQTAKLEAEKRRQKFRFFTLEPKKATFRFNPFSGFRSAVRTIPQLVQLVLDTLGLYHGVGYGKGYFSQRSRFLLSEALKATGVVNSFEDLYSTLTTLYGARKQDFRDAFELLSVIESLTYYPQLLTTKEQDEDDQSDTIRMDRVLEDSEVVYFWLPSVTESAAASTIGKLVLFNLQTAAHDRKAEGNKRRQAFLLIDEFQKLAGENFQHILQQARSAGIGAVLANQSLGDLKTPDWDLGPAIKTNTRVKMYFSINDSEDLKVIEQFSGEEVQMYGADDSEVFRPRMSAKELLALSDHPKRLLLHVSSGSGHTQFGGLPIPVETDWPISKGVADDRAAMPWPKYPPPPEATPPTPIARPKHPKPKAPKPVQGKVKMTDTKKSKPTPALAEMYEKKLRTLFDD